MGAGAVRAVTGDRVVQAAVLHPQHALRLRGDAVVVRHDDDRLPALGRERGEELDDLARPSPSRGCRSARRRARRAGSSRARARSRRAAARRRRAATADARRARSSPTSASSASRAPQLVRRHARGRELGLDVLERGQRRDQVERLEDEAERAQPDLGELVVAEGCEVAALEEDLPGGRPVERAEELQQRRLPRAARALDRDDLAGPIVRSTSSSAWIVTSPRRKVRVTPRSSYSGVALTRPASARRRDGAGRAQRAGGAGEQAAAERERKPERGAVQASAARRATPTSSPCARALLPRPKSALAAVVVLALRSAPNAPTSAARGDAEAATPSSPPSDAGRRGTPRRSAGRRATATSRAP